MFVGQYDRSVDGAGRLALPADFRSELGSRCYVTLNPTGFVELSTEAAFERAVEWLEEQIKAGEKPESAMRAFGASTQVVTVDRQGRITLDDAIRRHAGLRSRALIVGAVHKLEIWRPSRYRVIHGEHEVVEPAREWFDEDDE